MCLFLSPGGEDKFPLNENSFLHQKQWRDKTYGQRLANEALLQL